MDVLLNASRRLETLLAVALIGVSLAHAGLVARAMATTSLSTDEFGTIGTFSSKGPQRVLTDYRAPKNHIFFNLLNSLLPGRESWNPARARALSILATLLTGAAIAAYAAARGQPLAGAVVVALWSLAPEMLPLSMEARGYGFLGLFAVAATIALLEYTRSGRRGWLATLAAAGVLGTYTVPSFLILAGPMLLLLWLARRSRETFVAGAAAGVAILLLYAPVLRPLIAAFTGFHAQKDEMEFASVESLWQVVRLYVLPCANWQAAALLAACLLAPFAAACRRPAGERLGPCLVAAAGAIYLAVLVALRTPPLRLAACGLLPVVLGGVLSIHAGLPPLARRLVFAVIGLGLLGGGIRAIRDFDFLPSENWTLAARALDAAFAPPVKVDYARYAKYLKQTLPGAGERGAPFDAAALAAGRLVVADAGNKWAEGRRFVPPPGIPGLVEWTIPGRIRDVVLTFRAPESVPGLAGPLPPDGRTFSGRLPPGARALVLLLDRPATARGLAVEAPGAFVAGNAVVVPLDAQATAFDVALRPRAGGMVVTRAWFSQ